MNTYIKLPKKNLHIIGLLCFLLVLFISIETMVRVKDIQLFEDYLLNNKSLTGQGISEEEIHSDYLTIVLSKYFFKIISPIFLSIHIYFTYKSLRISPLFIFMWIITLTGSLSYIVLEGAFYSIFYYIDIFIYILLIISILSLKKLINKKI